MLMRHLQRPGTLFRMIQVLHLTVIKKIRLKYLFSIICVSVYFLIGCHAQSDNILQLSKNDFKTIISNSADTIKTHFNCPNLIFSNSLKIPNVNMFSLSNKNQYYHSQMDFDLDSLKYIEDGNPDLKYSIHLILTCYLPLIDATTHDVNLLIQLKYYDKYSLKWLRDYVFKFNHLNQTWKMERWYKTLTHYSVGPPDVSDLKPMSKDEFKKMVDELSKRQKLINHTSKEK